MIPTRSRAARAVGAIAAAALALVGVVAVAVVPAAAAPSDTVVYDSVPATLASSYPSLGYQATSTDEFGDYIVLGGSQRELTTATVGMVSWTCGNWESGSSPCTTTPGDTYTHPITLNLYAVDTSGAVPAAGTLLTSITQDQAIPYRPSASAECTGGNAGKWWDGAACNNGYAFTLTFDLGGVVVPGEVIVAVAYNTQTHGAAPAGVTGPYNSLNVALAPAAPSVGTDETEDEVLWDTSVAGFYADGGAGGTDTLRVDTDWSGYHGLILRLSATSPVTNVECSAITTASAATDLNLDGWDFAQTRAHGSNTFVPGGLQVTTTVGDSLAKAAGYKAIDIALAEVGDIAIDLTGTTGVPPSVQLGTDLDNNGTQDGYLVYEPSYYGENLWASNAIVSGGFTGLPTVGGGGGLISGTIDQYLAAYPDARVLSFGYSLGSGVIGSSVITSITVGCTEYPFTKAPTVNVTCSAIADGGVATDAALDGWDFSQTRANGSNTFVADGLRVVTTVGDSLAKAAGYKELDIALAEVGQLDIDLSDVSGVPPSVQLVVDLDDNGSTDGILVYEPDYYGQNLWATNSIVSGGFTGLPAVGGGGGPVSGTIDQYLAAYPEARVVAFGYSLGSGVIGSAVIHSITVGCAEYGFAKEPVVNITCPAIDEGPVATNAALAGWDFSQTRANGSNTFVAGGLRVATTVGDSLAKAAGYQAIDLDLSQVGDIAIDLSDVTGVPPSVQLVVDLDDNGSTDGILVYEPDYYGENLWATNSIVGGGFVGLPAAPGGGGPVSGTIDQYLAAYPDAHVVGFGYSLGSGVIGSATITGITVGCVEYGFDGVVVPGTPTISGTPSMGQTLTAVPGTWAPEGVTFAYQWRSNGSPIASGTTENLLLTADLVGTTIDVVVTGTAPGVGNESATSASVVVAAGVLTTALPVIVGEASIGNTLTADPGTWGPAPVALSYQWLRDGAPIADATDSTYLLTFADAGNAVSVRVTGTKSGYTPASRTSDPTVSLPTDAIPAIERLSGPSRYETAVAISEGWAPGVDRVYVATGENYPDALSAAAAAAHFDAPVLLTRPGAVPAAVLAELERLAPDEIVIVGSTAAVADSVRTQLLAIASDPVVVRIGGIDRFETSRLIAEDAFGAGGATIAYVATGHNFPDALSAAPAAASIDGPVVLVPGLAGSVDAATIDLLDDLGIETVKIVGSAMAVSAGVEAGLDSQFDVVRLQGANRYGTAIAVNLDAFDTAPTVYLATGENFPDALAGAARAGYEGRPLFISQQQCIPTAIMDAITTLNPGRIVLLGGTPALSTRVEDLETC